MTTEVQQLKLEVHRLRKAERARESAKASAQAAGSNDKKEAAGARAKAAMAARLQAVS